MSELALEIVLALSLDGFAATTAASYRTSATESLTALNPQPVTAGQLTTTLKGRSITTFVLSAGGPSTSYALQAGWNLLGPQLPAGTTLSAASVLAAILGASHGQLAAIYGLSNNRWTPSLIQQTGESAIGSDFPLQSGVGYLVYTDKQATVTLGAGAPGGAGHVIHTGLGAKQRAGLPPLPKVP